MRTPLQRARSRTTLRLRTRRAATRSLRLRVIGRLQPTVDEPCRVDAQLASREPARLPVEEIDERQLAGVTTVAVAVQPGIVAVVARRDLQLDASERKRALAEPLQRRLQRLAQPFERRRIHGDFWVSVRGRLEDQALCFSGFAHLLAGYPRVSVGLGTIPIP